LDSVEGDVRRCSGHTVEQRICVCVVVAAAHVRGINFIHNAPIFMVKIGAVVFHRSGGGIDKVCIVAIVLCWSAAPGAVCQRKRGVGIKRMCIVNLRLGGRSRAARR
jgi:hypothetical protein